jgi:sec-independent protein translocase protein TatA
MTAVIFSGHWEWLVVLVIALLLFGHRIPGMARSLGSGITEFKKGLKKGEKDDDDTDGDEHTKTLSHQDSSSAMKEGQQEKTTQSS